MRSLARRASTSGGSAITTCRTASAASRTSTTRATATPKRASCSRPPKRRCRWAGWSATVRWRRSRSNAATGASASATRSPCCAPRSRPNSASRERVHWPHPESSASTSPRRPTMMGTEERPMKRRDMLIGAAMSSAAGVAALATAGTAMAQTPAAAPPAPAAGGVGTLDRIIKEKKIRVTAEVTSPPFGILDKDNQPDGSEIATARQLAKDMGVELELVQVTAPQRIPALLAGRADVAISSLSITLDRAKTVMFAPPHGALSIVLAGGKGKQIRNAGEMAGKKIGLTRATLEEATVPK